jgi:hypothetical protein
MMKEKKADPFRGLGRTTRAMQLQPKGAVYIVVGAMSYYKDLACKLKREDLELVDWQIFLHSRHRFHGRRFSAVYLDHAVYECLSPKSWDEMMAALEWIRPMIRPYAAD